MTTHGLTTHGQSQKRGGSYRVWQMMKQRCDNPRHKSFKNYGARGIKVCNRWSKSFEEFASDVGPRPGPEYSLERMDNSGNYEPGNVKWATPLEQANNKRTSHFVVYRGVKMTKADAVRAAGSVVPYESVSCRLRNGWTVERAVETPLLYRYGPDGRKIKPQAEYARALAALEARDDDAFAEAAE